jgi:hypothetical protein
MILKFKCQKQDLEDALRRIVGVRNPMIADNRDVENATRLLMDALGIEHTVEEGSIYIPTGCDLQDDEVTIGLRPGTVLIMFGPPNNIRDADKKWMLEQFRTLQDAVLGLEKKSDHTP